MCAIYTGSPFGTIRGKINGTVGAVWHGIQVMRQLKSPTNRGSVLKYQQMKDAIIPPEQFSFAQFNHRRLVMNPLLKIAVDNMSWIRLVWSPQTKQKQLKMQGVNMFMRRNIANFEASIPNKAAEYNPATNAPDILSIVVSDGELEPTPAINTAEYDTATGQLDIDFSAVCTMNGKATDTAYALVVALPLLDSYGRYGNWDAALRIEYFDEIGSRGTPSAFITLDPGLDADDLYFFVFFYSSELNRWSPSLVMQTTEPPPP